MSDSDAPGSTPDEVNVNSLLEAATHRVSAGHELSADAARDVMAALISGEISETVIVDFLAAMADKGPTAQELQGFLSAMRNAGVAVIPGRDVVDVVGTGGDGHHSVNISTMAAVALAATGVPVVKHGNRAATSLCGAADVLEALGVAISLSAESVKACVDEVGIAFCFAPAFHPAMRHVAAARRAFGRPTFFNLLGPLANPAHARMMLVGTADAQRAALLAQVLDSAGVTAAVVCADDGMDEVSTLVPTTVWMGGASAVIEPVALGLAIPEPGALDGGDAAYNADVARAVLDGVNEPRVNTVRDCVAVNAAAARAVWSGARDAYAVVEGISTQLQHVRAVMETGDAGRLLTRWAEVSSRLAAESENG